MIKFEENQLNNTEELFKSIYNDSPIGIELYDSNGKLIDLNQSCLELFGVSNKDEVKGFDLLSDPNIPKDILVKLKQRQTIHFESSFDFDLVKKHKLYQTKKSGKIYLDILITPLFLGESMSITNYIVQIQDVTNQEKAEQKLMNLNVELENQIHEKKKELTKAEERHRLILENASDLIVILDDNFKYEYINEQVHKKLMGYSKENLIGKSSLDFIHPDDLEEASKALRKGFNEGEGVGVIRIRNKKGGYTWLEISGKAFINKDGNTKGITISRDITKRKKAEEKLKESEEKFRTISDKSLVSIIIAQNGIIRYVNKQMEELSGYSLEEMKSWHAGEFLKIIHPDYRELVAEQSKKKQRGQDDVIDQYQIKGIKKSGEHIWVDNYSKTIVYEGNLAVLSIMIDITDKKEAEEALRESEEKFRTIAEQSLMGIIILQDNKIKYVNSAAARMLNYTIDEILNMPPGGYLNFIDPDDRNIVVEQAKKRQKGIETSITGYEHRCLKKNGDTIWIQNYSKIINYEGDFADLITVIDITDRKKAEEIIRESEKKLTDLIESVPIGISISTPDGKILSCNSYAFQILGYSSREEFLNIPVINFYQDTSDREKFLELLEKGLVKDFEVKFKRKDGSVFWVSLTSVAYNEGDKTMFVNSFQDITERKNAEIIIQQSEAELAAIYNYTPIVILLLDKERRIRKINKFALNFTDRREEEVFGIHGGEALRCLYSIKDPRGCGFSEQCQECIIRNTVLDTFNTKIPHINQEATLYLLPGGDINKVHLLISTVPLKFGGEDLVLISLIDITNLKKTEQKLIESEKKYRTVINNIPGMVYRGHPDWTVEFLSNCEVISGYTEEDFLSQKLNWVDIIHPNDRECIINEGYLLNERPMSLSQIYRIITKNSSIRWVNDRKISFFDENGVFCGVDGIVYDITDYKLAEQKLKESEIRYRDLFENSPIALFEQDFSELKSYIDNLKSSGVSDFEKYFEENFNEIINFRSKVKLIDVNRKALELYKANNKDDFISRKAQLINGLYQAATEEVLLANKKEMLSLINGYNMFETELTTKTLTGDSIYLYVRTLITPGSENTWSKVIVSLLDITNRMMTEQKLKESEEKFRNIAEQTSLGLLIQQDGIIKFANSAVADMSEYPMREINNWAVEDLLTLFYEEDLPLINAMANLVRSDNFDTSEQFECRIVTKSGIMKWLEIIAKPMIYLGKKAVFATLIDTTAKKKLEEELKEISRLKSELLSRTSHELKTPLVSIKGYADLLLSQHYEMLDIYTVSVLHEIKQGCYRLESLIKDLIETSKLESDEIELNKSEDDLAFLVKFCIRDLKGLLENRKHKLILDIHDKLITVFEKERIYEVITNLLSNAIKYTPRNGIISIKSEIKENTYIISIEDNGVGLSDDEKFKIFKKFGKVERYGKGMDVVSEGSGLGLYISKKIIELHEGNIWVESKGRDKGSTFHFSLPIIK